VASRVLYRAIVSNAGPDKATEVTLTDALPPHVTFDSATPSQGRCQKSRGKVACALGDLVPGVRAEVEIVVIPTRAGQITNKVKVKSESKDSNKRNNTDREVTTVIAG
jgi:uncharacterized repeat protein (TIGR01451 family)